jgi:hypothetical protein
MKKSYPVFCTCILVILFCVSDLQSQSVSGLITNENKEPLINAIIVVAEKNTGVSTNNDGKYYLKLTPGKYKLYVSYLGYQTDTFNVSLRKGDQFNKDINLKPVTFSLNSVLILSSQHTTAERIVLSAITFKDEYLSKIRNYENSAYSRTSFIIKSDSNKEDIVGITEVQSKAYFSAPNNFQEIILSKKQTANFSSLYNVFSSGKPVSVLDDIMNIDELAVISPLSKNALDYYNYEITDTMYLNSKRIFNIVFMPKRKNLPLFEGKMSIIDNVFTVSNVELNGKEKIKAATKSDIIIKQSFREFENYFWFPVQTAYSFSLDLGIQGLRKLYITQQSSFFNYIINNSEFNHIYTDRILLQQELSKEADDSLWENAQYIPLSFEEQMAYKHLDSLMENKNFLMKTLIRLPDYYLKLKNMPFTDLWDFYRYNRVEGNFAGAGFSFSDILGFSNLQITSGYGFSDKKVKCSLFGDYSLSQYISVNASVFRNIAFLDSYYDYKKYDITINQLLFNNDYADYYYSQGIKTGIKFKNNQNFSAVLTFGSQINKSVTNVNTNSLFNKNRIVRESIPILEGRYNTVEFSFAFDNRKYLDYGWGYIQSNAENYFNANLNYRTAPGRINKAENSYNAYYLQLSRYVKLPPYFNILFSIKAGYIDKDSVIQQNFHLPGVYSSVINARSFQTLKSDRYLGDRFLAVFIENNFKNTIFNLFSLPYLKNSKFDLYINANAGWMNNRNWGNGANGNLSKIPFTEAGFGIGNIFFFMRVDFSWRITHREKNNFFINISSNFTY